MVYRISTSHVFVFLVERISKNKQHIYYILLNKNYYFNRAELGCASRDFFEFNPFINGLKILIPRVLRCKMTFTPMIVSVKTSNTLFIIYSKSPTLHRHFSVSGAAQEGRRSIDNGCCWTSRRTSGTFLSQL